MCSLRGLEFHPYDETWGFRQTSFDGSRTGTNCPPMRMEKRETGCAMGSASA